MKKTTLQQLASLAGVGIATVDRVINERGGVSPQTTRKVLLAAKSAGIQRILPEEHRHPWQIEVILSANDTYFFKKLAASFRQIADTLGYRRLTLHRTLLPEKSAQKVAEHIVKCSTMRDGIIVFAQDTPAVHRALEHCQQHKVPVVTVASPLSHPYRLAHVGIEQYQAGRTAAFLMAKTLTGSGDVLMVSGHHEYAAHQQRIQGFKHALAEYAPQLNLVDVLLAGDHAKTLDKLLCKALQCYPLIAGIYNTGDVNSIVSEQLAKHQLLGQCTYITHELYPLTEQLLHNQGITFIIDQNPSQHAELSLNLLLDKLDNHREPSEERCGKVNFSLFTRENR